jgi:hypothetical protein
MYGSVVDDFPPWIILKDGDVEWAVIIDSHILGVVEDLGESITKDLEDRRCEWVVEIVECSIRRNILQSIAANDGDSAASPQPPPGLIRDVRIQLDTDDLISITTAQPPVYDPALAAADIHEDVGAVDGSWPENGC